MRRSLIAAAILLLIAAVIASLELVEPQPPRDAVAAAERELGIELEASRVDVGDVELFVV
jgi:hypothetical protein